MLSWVHHVHTVKSVNLLRRVGPRCDLVSSQWRHNDHDEVSNHQPHGYLLNLLFGRWSKKTSQLRVTGLCAGNSPGPVNSPHKWPVTRKMFPLMTSSCNITQPQHNSHNCRTQSRRGNYKKNLSYHISHYCGLLTPYNVVEINEDWFR